MSKLLNGGNPQVQNTFYRFCLLNKCSELFFQKIYITLHNEIAKSKNQIYRKNMKSKNMLSRILRLLQLFCEGHNQNLQNYLKFQSFSKINYDMITSTVSCLENLLVNNQNFGIISQCLDTLTEYIQGPCYENQQTVAYGKFLEYAVELLNVHTNFILIYYLNLLEK